MDPWAACRLLALACSEAVAYDAAVPRPGLSSATRPRRDPDPSSILAVSPRAYELCLRSCTVGCKRQGSHWVRYWVETLKDIMRRGWGNPGHGMLFLLSLHAAALGRALETRGRDSLEAVMGASCELVDEAGVEGAVLFYESLAIASPSYLGRLSWGGLPDASAGSLAALEVYEKKLTLRELLALASLYDPVSRDAERCMQVSLGTAYPVLLEHKCDLERALQLAIFLVLGVEGDMLVSRKLGVNVSLYAWRAYRGDIIAERELWRILRFAGPGSVADIVVNALARLLYEAEAGRVKVGFTGC